MKKSIFAILLLASLSSVGQVVTAPMPSPRFQVFTSAGLPLAGGCLFSYQSGTSNPLATYKDNLGVAQNSNPVLLDSTGSADVWLPPQKVKLQLFSAGGVNCASGSLLWTRDGVYGPNLPVTTTLALIAQTAPSCVAGSYTIWADSSATRFKMCNNGTADVVVGANTSDTLTNKTLTSPAINTPTAAGGTYSGTITNSGNNTFSGANTHTGTEFSTNAGVFDQTAQHEYLTSSLNGCSAGTEWTASQTTHATDAIAGCAASPNGATAQANGISGYATGNPGSSIVGGFFQGRCLVNGCNGWGSNSVIQDVAGMTANGLLFGHDVNVNLLNAPAAYPQPVSGMNVALAAPTNAAYPNANAYICQLFGASPGQWSTCYSSASGATATAFSAGYQPGAAPQPSQTFNFYHRDGGGVARLSQFYSDTTGRFNISAFLGNIVVSEQGNGKAILAFTGNTSAQTYTFQDVPMTMTGRIATIDLTAQNNNIGNTSLYVVPASGAGLYRVSCYVIVTTAAGTSSTLPNCNLLWTDKDNSQAQTIAIATGGSGNTLTTLAQGTVVVNVKASTTMQYSTTGYASNAANAMQYAIHIKLEAL